MADDPTPRAAARVLMLDPSDRVLLLSMRSPATGRVFWHVPGGGLEPGEDARDAATREVAEETGLRDVRLGPEIWHRRHVYTWRGRRYDQSERWFLARVPSFAPTRAGLTEAEQEEVLQARWWSLPELQATDEVLSPRALAVHLADLLADGPAAAPVEIGR